MSEPKPNKATASFTAELVPKSNGDGGTVGTISVWVKDADTGAWLSEANIHLTHQSTEETWTGVTNSDGIEDFTDMPLGTYTVAVTKEGYQPWSGELTLE